MEIMTNQWDIPNVKDQPRPWPARLVPRTRRDGHGRCAVAPGSAFYFLYSTSLKASTNRVCSGSYTDTSNFSQLAPLARISNFPAFQSITIRTNDLTDSDSNPTTEVILSHNNFLAFKKSRFSAGREIYLPVVRRIN